MQWFETWGVHAGASLSGQLVHQTYLPDHTLAADIYELPLGLGHRVVAHTSGGNLIADGPSLDEAIEFVWAWLGAVI